MFVLMFVIWMLVAATAGFADEVLIPFDSTGRITTVDAKLNNEIGVFRDSVGFREARLFRTDDSSFVLEVLVERNSTLVRERRTIDAIELARIRRIVKELTLAYAPQYTVVADGRTKLITGYTLLSMAYYGWAIPVAGEMEGDDGAALYGFTAGMGFALPYLLSVHSSVPDGAATQSLHSATRGIFHGPMLYRALNGKRPKEDRNDVGLGVVASLVEGIGGYVIARHAGWSGGQAEMHAAGEDIGLGIGLAMNEAMHREDEDEFRAAESSIPLLTSAVGDVAGHLLTTRQSYSRGDAYVFRTASFLGAIIPVGFFQFGEKSERANDATMWGAIGGAIGGAAAGHYLTRDVDYTTRQGIISLVGALAGSAIGLGLSAIIFSDDGANSDAGIWILTSASATGMFALVVGNERGIAPRAKPLSQTDVEVSPSWTYRNGEIAPSLRMAVRF